MKGLWWRWQRWRWKRRWGGYRGVVIQPRAFEMSDGETGTIVWSSEGIVTIEVAPEGEDLG